MMGIFPRLTAFWWEHFVSNFQWVFNGYTIYLFIKGDFAWNQVTGYIISSMFVWFLTWFFGTDTIRFLDEDYPFIDTLLYPSIFYLLGIIDHDKYYPFEDIPWPEEKEGELEEEAALEEEDQGDMDDKEGEWNF